MTIVLESVYGQAVVKTIIPTISKLRTAYPTILENVFSCPSTIRNLSPYLNAGDLKASDFVFDSQYFESVLLLELFV